MSIPQKIIIIIKIQQKITINKHCKIILPIKLCLCCSLAFKTSTSTMCFQYPDNIFRTRFEPWNRHPVIWCENWLMKHRESSLALFIYSKLTIFFQHIKYSCSCRLQIWALFAKVVETRGSRDQNSISGVYWLRVTSVSEHYLSHINSHFRYQDVTLMLEMSSLWPFFKKANIFLYNIIDTERKYFQRNRYEP